VHPVGSYCTVRQDLERSSSDLFEDIIPYFARAK